MTVKTVDDDELPRESVSPRERMLEQALRAVKGERDHALKERDEAVAGAKMRTQLIANISHEIRTPMSGIMGLTEILIDDLEGEQKDMAEHIHDAARMLLKIVNDLLDIAKLENGTVHLDCDLFAPGDLVKDIVTECRTVAEKKNLEIRDRILVPDGEELYGDASRIRQILLNLVLNAIKFTDRGHIEVYTEIYHDDANELLTVCVKDTGCGISPPDLEKIFKPFIQVDGSLSRRHGGTGLGLALSRQLVELMGGEISVESDVGDGSTFTFYVPLKSTNNHAAGQTNRIDS